MSGDPMTTPGLGVYRVPPAVLRETFAVLRRCGAGCRECQALWVSPWSDPGVITAVVHPVHRARGDGFELDGEWLTTFWGELARTESGVRVQIHTHPGAAFHSPTDDEWPIIHTPGFLSLVIPDFAHGAVGFTGAYLTEIQPEGTWREVRDIADRLEVA
jgi:hypothetical protein